MRRFVPAIFDLYEFDQSDQRANTVRRWFDHWDGPMGQPAEEVTLSWSAADAVALVCTSGRSYSDAEARLRACHLALGGTTLPLPERPASAADTFQEMERLSSTATSWSTHPNNADQAQLKIVNGRGFATGYTLLRHGAIFVAATGVAPDELQIRPVRDMTSYDVDATVSFPLSSLHRD